MRREQEAGGGGVRWGRGEGARRALALVRWFEFYDRLTQAPHAGEPQPPSAHTLETLRSPLHNLAGALVEEEAAAKRGQGGGGGRAGLRRDGRRGRRAWRGGVQVGAAAEQRAPSAPATQNASSLPCKQYTHTHTQPSNSPRRPRSCRRRHCPRAQRAPQGAAPGGGARGGRCRRWRCRRCQSC